MQLNIVVLTGIYPQGWSMNLGCQKPNLTNTLDLK